MAHSADSELRRLAVQRIGAGRLPCDSAARMWGSQGTGAACALCDHSIVPEEIEYEVELDGKSARPTLQFHLACYSVWLSVCESLQEGSRR